MSRFGDCPKCGRGLWCVSTVHRDSTTPGRDIAVGVCETTVTYECRDVTGVVPSACGYWRVKVTTRRVPQTLKEYHTLGKKARQAI